MYWRMLVLIMICLSAGLAAQLPTGVVLNTDHWIPFPLTSFDEVKGTALDMSWLLEAPAGKHGFLTVRGDKFIFKDGTEGRFWGGNIFGEANFGDREEAERLADIIARSGANLVRMHHLDVVKPWTDKVVQRSLFGGQMPATTRKFDPQMLDRFHYMVYCLKQRGIYIFLSHQSSRFVMKGDGFPGDDSGLEDVGQGFKGEGMFDPYLIELQKEYLTTLLSTRNPYTGLAMLDDPALVLTEITNENSMFWIQADGAFGINSPHYQTMLQAQFSRWLLQKYQNEAALVNAWTQKGRTALFDGESISEGRVKIPHVYVSSTDWPVSDQRKSDTYQFLYDMQDDYYQQMHQFLTGLGLKIPITGSNHWCNDLADLHLNAKLDYVDRHSYWTHPRNEYNYIAGQGIMAEAMVKSPTGGHVGEDARRSVFGKPYTVSEWHNPLPNPYRAEGTPIMAAYSCLLDWHPMHYAYWGAREAQPDTINSFEAMFDPTQFNMLPISALMFHRRDFKESENGYYEVITPKQVMNPTSPIDSHPQTALVGKYGLAFTDLPATPACNDVTLLKSALEAHGHYISSTGELTWDSNEGLVTLNSARTQGIIGFVGGKRIATNELDFALTTPFAVVLVASLTPADIKNSEHLLISTSADARYSNQEINDDFSLITRTGQFPFLMQPVEGTVTLKTSAPIQVFRLSPGGRRLGQIQVIKSTEGMTIPLNAGSPAMHYEIVRQK